MDHARELTVLCSFITPGGEGQPNPQKLILALGTSGLSPCSLTGSPFGHLLTDFATDDELRATFVSDVWQSSPKFWFIVWCIQSVSLPVSVLELGTGSGVIRLLISLTREWFEHFKLWIILCLVYIYIYIFMWQMNDVLFVCQNSHQNWSVWRELQNRSAEQQKRSGFTSVKVRGTVKMTTLCVFLLIFDFWLQD